MSGQNGYPIVITPEVVEIERKTVVVNMNVTRIEQQPITVRINVTKVENPTTPVSIGPMGDTRDGGKQ